LVSKKNSKKDSTTINTAAVEALSPAMLRQAEWVRLNHKKFWQTEITPRVGSRVWVVYSSSRRAQTFQMDPAVISEVRQGACNNTVEREIEKFIIRQPPMGEKDDYDSENSWI